MTLRVFRQLAKKIRRIFSRLARIVWKKRRRRRTIQQFPTTERYSSSLKIPTEATREPKSTSEPLYKIDQTSTGNQNQNIGNVNDNSTVLRDVYGNVYFGTYKRPVTGIPFQAPYLPQYFVERPKHHKHIKTLLLSEKGNRTGTLVVSAIYGLGGIGKSTLAAAVAHDPEVQAQFSDGVLWVTLGQKPDLLPLLSDWIQALGDYDYKPLTLEGASKHLRTLLHDKKALLVVDDAWNPEHVEPFRVGGSSCRVLVTTREATIRGAITYDLEVMTPSESLELLQKSQNNPLTEAEKQQAQELAQTVGYLPLALDLAAAQVADGVSWQELLEDLCLEIAHLESLQSPGADSCIHEEQRKRYSLIASFNLSLRSLTPEMLRQFAWFGVLPEDAMITETMAATLWQINRRQALTTLRSFKTKALLLPGVIGDDQKQTYRLHDLMHNAAKQLLTSDLYPNKPEELPGLGLSLAAAHCIFLDRYRSKTQQRLWHTLVDDGYIHTYLSWHLEQASRTEELHQLLMEETTQGRNGWYETCERLGQTVNFVTDVARAWRLAEETFEKSPKQSIALQCRYALITTSLNSLAKNIPASLMAALVKQKLWTPAQGLAYTQQAKESRQRAQALSALAPHLSKSLLSIALDSARSIQDDSDRAHALSGLAPYVPGILQEALDAVHSIKSDFERASALLELAPHLPETVIPQIFNAVCSLKSDSNRAYALSGLAPHLPKALLPKALNVVCSIQDDFNRAQALSGLAPHLPKALLPKALKAVRSIKSGSARAQALSGLAPYVPEILQEALNAARSMQYDCELVHPLSGLAPYVPGILQEALDAVSGITFSPFRAHALSELAPHLSKALLPQALVVARSIEDDSERVKALLTLAPHLPEIVQEAFDVVHSTHDFYRTKVLEALAPHLPEALLPKALYVVRSIQDDSNRAEALLGLAPHLPGILQEALEAVNSIKYDNYISEVLLKLIPHLPETLLPQALHTAYSIKSDSDRAYTLSRLEAYIPEKLLPQVINAARSIQDASFRILALSRLAPDVPGILHEALDAARSIQDSSSRALALSRLVPDVPGILQEALDAARSIIQPDYFRAEALLKLAPYVPEILQEALDAVLSIQSEYYPTEALSTVMPHLPKTLLPEVLSVVCSIQVESYRTEALSALAPYLPEVLLPQALDVARSIEDNFYRVEALLGLAPYIPGILQEALDTALSMEDAYSFRARSLAKVLPHLPEVVLPQVLGIIYSIEDDSDRAEALSELAPYLPETLLPQVLDAVRGIEDNSNRAKALSGLAPHLPETLLPQALNTIRSIQGDSDRAMCFSSLLPALNIASIKFDLWSEILHNLSHRYRYQLLQDIPKLSDSIIALGGTEALGATVLAIQDVCKQWR